jgi:hypothetical protein
MYPLCCTLSEPFFSVQELSRKAACDYGNLNGLESVLLGHPHQNSAPLCVHILGPPIVFRFMLRPVSLSITFTFRLSWLVPIAPIQAAGATLEHRPERDTVCLPGHSFFSSEGSYLRVTRAVQRSARLLWQTHYDVTSEVFSEFGSHYPGERHTQGSGRL